MNRIITFISILLVISSVLADTVASVEDYKISYQQLSDAMSQFRGNNELSFAEVRERCLNRLIDEQVLIVYAGENNISVAEDELDAFFIRELGDHERFLTNDMFDYYKFEEFKLTDTGQKILSEMRSELLVSKTSTLIRNNLRISDATLLQEFILENVELDLGYASASVQEANALEDFTTRDALNYYYDNRRDFKTPRKVKFEFMLIPRSDFRAEAEIYYENVIESIYYDGDELKEINRDSLKAVFVEKEIDKIAERECWEMIQRWKSSQHVDYPILESPYLSEDDLMGCLDRNIIGQAMLLRKDQFSEPLKLKDYGYIILHQLDIREPETAELIEVRDQVWKAYINHEKSRLYSEDFRRYFINNIDDFIIPAAVVYKIEISRPRSIFSLRKEEYQSSIRSLLQANMDNEEALEEIADDYGLKSSNRIILLKKFSNENDIDQEIAESINKGRHAGFITSETDLFFYRVSTLFPEYIPNFSDIEKEINDLIYVEQLENSDYQQYYNDHKKDFSTPDSLRIGGVYFPVFTDTLKIDAQQVRDFYDSNIKSFYRERTVEFDYIFSSKYEFAELARKFALEGVSLDLLDLCYGESTDLESNRPVLFQDLDPDIADLLANTRDNEYSEISEYKDGFIFFYKTSDYPAGLRKFEEVRDEIGARFKYEIADSIAFTRAKTVFDSTRYFSQCLQYAPVENIFETSLLPVDSRFEYLGNLDEFEDELLRMWKNEKYSSIIKLEQGYAVIYLLERTYSRQLTFDESLDEIKAIFAARKRYRTARDYMNNIRNKVIAGEDPEELLYFLGGWKREFDLTLQSQVFPEQYNRLIMNDIAKKEAGYCSPVISPVEDQLLFYRIERMEKVSNREFEQVKNEFRDKIMDQRYREWLKSYKKKLDIKIRI